MSIGWERELPIGFTVGSCCLACGGKQITEINPKRYDNKLYSVEEMLDDFIRGWKLTYGFGVSDYGNLNKEVCKTVLVGLNYEQQGLYEKLFLSRGFKEILSVNNSYGGSSCLKMYALCISFKTGEPL